MDDKTIWSDNFIERIKTAYQKRTLDVPKKPEKRVSESINGVSGVGNGVSGVGSTQSKVNKSKVKKTRDTSVSLSVSPTDDVKNVFDYHCVIIGNCRKLTPMRKQKITARLKDGFSVDDLYMIIDFTAQDDFWCGDNDRGTVYNQIDTIFRSTEKTEKNLNDARKWNNNGRVKHSNIGGLDGLRKFAERHNVGDLND
jgi:uncharacterized phage protein (TIGR02220 family)